MAADPEAGVMHNRRSVPPAMDGLPTPRLRAHPFGRKPKTMARTPWKDRHPRLRFGCWISSDANGDVALNQTRVALLLSSVRNVT